MTWHDGAIPSDEIWVKLGGDKGRGSFKLNLQLVNTANPNSMKGTALLSVFKAGDTTTNLHTALNMYKEHVIEAQGMLIKYKKPFSFVLILQKTYLFLGIVLSDFSCPVITSTCAGCMVSAVPVVCAFS